MYFVYSGVHILESFILSFIFWGCLIPVWMCNRWVVAVSVVGPAVRLSVESVEPVVWPVVVVWPVAVVVIAISCYVPNPSADEAS